jgi:hypothetical protein
MARPISRSERGGKPPQAVPAGRRAGEHARPADRRVISARTMAALVLVTGLWVAISPRFLTSHAPTNAAYDVTIGLVVAGIGVSAMVSRKVFPGRQFTTLVLGVWAVLVSSFILDASFSIKATLYWSDTWSGAALAVLALAELATLRSAAR